VKTPEELVARFREQGYKVTPQRQLIFRLLNGNTAHPTAETLYEVAAEQMPGISLRTVYQTLSELSAMGEVQHIDRILTITIMSCAAPVEWCTTFMSIKRRCNSKATLKVLRCTALALCSQVNVLNARICLRKRNTHNNYKKETSWPD
jgi:Fe2+ or Zn2+ uptake regulation protein